MLIAGDIGATKTCLSLISPTDGPRKSIAEEEFHSNDFNGLEAIVEGFLAKNKAKVNAACFGIPGPVIGGRAHLTNLPWELEERALAQSLQVRKVSLLNDLQAVAYAVPGLEPEDVLVVNEGVAVDTAAFFASESTYSLQQMYKPQTLGLALADSPIGFASWVIEKYRSWSDCGGEIERCFSKDALITSIMTYLVSYNVQSAIWLYNSLKAARPIEGKIAVPLGFAEFHEQRDPPPRGGHFAAWEQPGLFADEVASFFDEWR